MKAIILIVIALGVGFFLGRYTARIIKGKKQKHLAEILHYLESHDQITNNEVEKMFAVSDATAERYLNELEKEGAIAQLGKTGRNVSYTKNTY